jgi:DNA polymerase I-like protein with 3'-5' exonuclease and polymerase domains
MGTAQTLSIETGIPKKDIDKFQERYFTVLPAILKLHHWIAFKIERDQFLINVFNRKRDFFDRPDSAETHRKGMAFMQASPNADDINLGILRIWTKMKDRVQLLTQEHDAVYFQFREDDNEEEVIAEAQQHLKVEIPLTKTRTFSVPTEAKTGYNKGLRWEIDKQGNKIEVNPRGLDKPGAKR